ncbi:amidohydrolase family protein [Rhizobium leguminosarum]|uniref:amidohydrolase family protein n=1 Tax=Rhizobium leguminosarum TaxID=384 RepID=UPI00103DFE98|nr:amidohydrolase family protein [Rhizobium leguminosarum]MDV4163572.1 amidohydrolase family protein [Rhizobium leguminosarum]MDV4173454.1 amidohydrolase family protein [Rhizobium leguminosarum]NKJ94867.1 amidohydrolase family protein [Rhizobium leguminosarum bv. viciae]NKK44131.1 amidohydrolase family protein [Rhizobium leguminosarum bv. viciae]QIO62977.1 amidohydrolase family protein [Rhizobium leguminosarum bv. trifolii]
MAIDFVIRNARLAGLTEPTDIAFEAGRIAAIAPGFVCDAPHYDAGEKFACAGLIETHIHLDKAGIISRCNLCTGTLAEAISETSRAKAAFTEEDVYARAAVVVEKAILNGTIRLRTFVEIDPRAGFRSFEAIRRLKADYASLVDIEICAFAQEGLTNDPDTEEMLEQALKAGADLVGGCPYTDPEPTEHIRRIFDIAMRHDVAVDFHLDFDLDPAGSNLPTIIVETVARRYQGRVSVGHVTKLSALPLEELESIGRRLAESGIALTVLPATDLFLTGRNSTFLIPRGVTPAHRLAALGVVTTISTNNVLNPFTPFGDVNLMRMANLYANIAQIGTTDGLDGVFAMITAQAATLLGIKGYGIAIGSGADVVLFDAPSAADAVATIAPALIGWKKGRRSFLRPRPRLFVHEG